LSDVIPRKRPLQISAFEVAVETGTSSTETAQLVYYNIGKKFSLKDDWGSVNFNGLEERDAMKGGKFRGY
jgi:hypothetical protein